MQLSPSSPVTVCPRSHSSDATRAAGIIYSQPGITTVSSGVVCNHPATYAAPSGVFPHQPANTVTSSGVLHGQPAIHVTFPEVSHSQPAINKTLSGVFYSQPAIPTASSEFAYCQQTAAAVSSGHQDDVSCAGSEHGQGSPLIDVAVAHLSDASLSRRNSRPSHMVSQIPVLSPHNRSVPARPTSPLLLGDPDESDHWAAEDFHDPPCSLPISTRQQESALSPAPTPSWASSPGA